MNIRISTESRRGCGFRKPGGKYLVSAGNGRACGALPIEMCVCPTCHAGIKPARGWTWIDLQAIRGGKPCIAQAEVQTRGPDYCAGCPFFNITKAGLLWIGEQYYPTVDDFMKEGREQGISRRIAQIPRDFKLGETWVAFAHRKAIAVNPGDFTLTNGDAQEPQFKPGIFHLFQPTAIEYIVKAGDSQEKLEALEARGISLVRVIRKEESEAA